MRSSFLACLAVAPPEIESCISVTDLSFRLREPETLERGHSVQTVQRCKEHVLHLCLCADANSHANWSHPWSRGPGAFKLLLSSGKTERWLLSLCLGVGHGTSFCRGLRRREVPRSQGGATRAFGSGTCPYAGDECVVDGRESSCSHSSAVLPASESHMSSQLSCTCAEGPPHSRHNGPNHKPLKLQNT